jgi:hypothetical protein
MGDALYADPDHLKGLGIVSPSSCEQQPELGLRTADSHVYSPELLEDFSGDYGHVSHMSSGGEVDARQRMSFTAADNSR